MTRIAIDPITRIEGHLRLEVEVSAGRVKDVWSTGAMFRGIERIIEGRDPREAWIFAQRVCGVCTHVHALASVRAVENALHITVPPNARLVRNILAGTLAVQDHVVHFYHLHSLDWVDITAALSADPTTTATLARANNPNWANNTAAWFAQVQSTLQTYVGSGQLGPFSNGYWGHPAYKLTPDQNLLFFAHYLEALDFQRETVKIHAILGGKNPHPQTYVVGGMSLGFGPDVPAGANPANLATVSAIAATAKAFTDAVLLPDVVLLAKVYKNPWASLGAGVGNFLTYGDYPETSAESKGQVVTPPPGGFPSDGDPGEGRRGDDDRRNRHDDEHDDEHEGEGDDHDDEHEGEGDEHDDEHDDRGGGFTNLFPAGRVTRMHLDGDVREVDQMHVAETVARSWYEYNGRGGDAQLLHPWDGETEPVYSGPTPPYKMITTPKYTWLKAPRYDGDVYEVGPLARLTVGYAARRPEIRSAVDGFLRAAGLSRRQWFSVIGRIGARALETQLIANHMLVWAAQLQANQAGGDLRIADNTKWEPATWPATAKGFGTVEAPRGSLGHWVKIDSQKVSGYQMVVPTTWNGSPRDGEGKRGAWEQALVGIPLVDPTRPLEVLRAVHSFDPCMGCSVHVHDPGGTGTTSVTVV
ncbi:MAG: nickel-dependent hydrogenase large subunit [Ilumatobacteraceae bacterium]